MLKHPLNLKEFVMRPKTVGFLSLITLVLSLLWLVLLIWSVVESGPLKTVPQVIIYVSEMDLKFVLTYVNATLITICTTIFFAGLYAFIKTRFPLWATIGLIFVPVYCVLNVVAYLSQLTVVPGLVELQTSPVYGPCAELMLLQVVQQWEGSAVAFINLTGYAILGIPSIIFGFVLFTGKGVLRFAGLFLAINGAVCIVAVIGLVLHNKIMTFGSIVGGVFFIITLVLSSIAFIGEKPRI